MKKNENTKIDGNEFRVEIKKRSYHGIKQFFCKHDYRPTYTTFLPSYEVCTTGKEAGKVKLLGHRESINFQCKKCGKETCDWFMPKKVIDRIKSTKININKKKDN